MANLIIIAIVIAILGCAIGYIISQKRKGVKCIGCSACSSKSCNAKHQSTTSQHSCCCDK